MKTLFQTLLLRTLSHKPDSVLLNYIQVVLSVLEKEFGTTPAPHKSKNDWITLLGNQDETRELIRSNQDFAQSLLIYILNSLLIAWSLIPLLNEELALSKDEKCLLCVWFTLQGYNSCYSSRVAAPLLTTDINLGEVLNLDMFWAQWREYLPEIDYLTQITLQNSDNNTSAKRNAFRVPEHRLRLTLHPLLSFSTIAAQLTSPADIVTTSAGDRLRALLKELGIDRALIYHRLRNCIGLLTNSIHNAVLDFTNKLNWQPILCFTEGVVYLAPRGSNLPARMALQLFIWEQISDQLVTNMLAGEIGFKRDGKGLKAAPQILELLSPAQLIQSLPSIVEAKIKNEIDPATSKRLANLNITTLERRFLSQGADLRSDRIAEFIIFLQKQFFRNNSEFTAWILEQLGLQSAITSEQAQIHIGGVSLGWYHTAAYYVVNNPHLDLESVTGKLQEIASQLAIWAEEKKLFPVLTSATREAFDRYLVKYLELPGWDNPESSWQHELVAYVIAKTKAARQPICSLSSGEFVSEAQVDSVVPFRPQQYSNKNPLGGRQLKRGISKIWSLEMLLRQVFWSASPGKLEEQQPIFLYFSSTFGHASQVTKAIHILVKQLERVNLQKICRFWQKHGMDTTALRFYPWLKNEPNSNEENQHNLTFLAMAYTTTRGKTMTDAWIEPALLALALPLVLGIKVIVTTSSVPPHNRDSEFLTTVQVDGPASFWNLLDLPTRIHLEEEREEQVKHLSDWLDRLLIAYSVHLDCQSKPRDLRWQAFPGTVQTITNDILAIFSLAHASFQVLSDEIVQKYWKFAQVWAARDPAMEQQLEITQRLVQEYRAFYQVHVAKSTYAIVLPLSKVLEDILSAPNALPIETLLLQTSGRLHDALRRQEPYKRPLIMDRSLSIEVRVNNEIQAIQQFVTTCINDLFLGQYKGDRALLQEHCNRIKSGAEFAYRLLAMRELKLKTKKHNFEGTQL